MNLMHKFSKKKINSHTLRFALLSCILFVFIFSSIITLFLFIILFSLEFGPIIMLKPILLPIATLMSFTLFGIFISSIISKNMLQPINDLIYATKEVSKGNYKVQVDCSCTNNGELFQLQKSFNHMTKELDSIELFRNDFINDFSHEFKTPIVSICGFAKQLKKPELTPEQRQEYIDIIISESDRLANMSSNILLLSKYESQQIITGKSDFLLDEQIRRSAVLLEKQWSNKNLNLELELDEISYCSNEEMFSHIWINLLSNAIKFTPINGTICISCKTSSNNVIIIFHDTGSGMDESTKEHLFEKFYQGETSHSISGNGLGLSIVKRIIDLSGGTITVESELNKGTTFTLKLPLSV